jgi:hypothetical protein
MNEDSLAGKGIWRPALGTAFLALALYILAFGVVDAAHWGGYTDTVGGCGIAVFVLAATGGALLFGNRAK